MVLIDENDLPKTRVQVLIDLLYESTGCRPPEDKVKFGKPQAVDQRPDLALDFNTFIPVRLAPGFDDRINKNAGLTYRRRNLGDYIRDAGVNLQFTEFPTTTQRIVDDCINPVVGYPLTTEDYVNEVLEDPEQAIFSIKARADSLLWISGGNFEIEPPPDHFFDLVDVVDILGFYVYGTEPA